MPGISKSFYFVDDLLVASVRAGAYVSAKIN